MCPTFSLGKNVDDVIQPELMPKDWYPFSIYKEPTQEPNKAMAAGGPGFVAEDGQKAGHNVIVDVRCIDDSEHKGRQFRFYVPLPKDGDDKRQNPFTGQARLDEIVTKNAKLARDFGGTVEGSEFSLSLGNSGMLFVTQKMNLAGTEMENQLDWFGAGSRPLGSADGTGGDPGDDEIPF